MEMLFERLFGHYYDLTDIPVGARLSGRVRKAHVWRPVHTLHVTAALRHPVPGCKTWKRCSTRRPDSLLSP